MILLEKRVFVAMIKDLEKKIILDLGWALNAMASLLVGLGC